jgi:CRP/FNR family transcriptional regulator
MSQAKTDTLKRIPLFASLDPSELNALAERGVEKHYSPNDVLFSEGEDCEGLFVLVKGTIKIYKTSSGGREMTIALEPAPGTVAELPLFDGGPYPASVSAVDEVTVLLLQKRDFYQVCRQYPEVSLKVLAVVGRRLRHLVTTLESVTFGSVRQRLARTLLEFSESAKEQAFALPVTHQELASRLGTVREVVSRNLGRFQIEGLIRISDRQIAITNRVGLEREANTEM